jgi:hypothetical protein
MSRLKLVLRAALTVGPFLMSGAKSATMHRNGSQRTMSQRGTRIIEISEKRKGRMKHD